MLHHNPFLIKAPSSEGAFPFQPLADPAIVGECFYRDKGFSPRMFYYWIVHAKWPFSERYALKRRVQDKKIPGFTGQGGVT